MFGRRACSIAVVLSACSSSATTTDLGSVSPDASLGFEDAATFVPDASPPPVDAGAPCEEPTEAALAAIDRSISFCAGELVLSAPARIVADDIIVRCEGTIISSALGKGTTAEPTIGFLLEGRRDVVIDGCTARGFRYGLVARDSRGLRIERSHFDDNFHDLDEGWAQDSVQGGGIRFDRVESSTVSESTFARNWNGIELRESHGNTIIHNVADHCSNTGATLVAAHRNRIIDNDMSFAIRPGTLVYPSNWYRIDTKDSAGIIIDAGSDSNLVERNNFEYGGDGVFIRSVIGACATNNIIRGNQTSFSPHNAIECWCDGNQFLENVASDSDYGIWLGGTDRGLVRGNTVERNLTDGISIQIGEDRHSVIEENIITGNGRVGILLTGREIQSWHPLTHFGPALANSSHLIIQRNRFAMNGPCAPLPSCDVFVQSSRSVMLASNCSDGTRTTEAALGMEAEGIFAAGACGLGEGDMPPLARLEAVAGRAGEPVVLDAERSSDPEGQPLNYHWLVQRAGARFTPASLPAAPLLGTAGARPMVMFDAPGLWEIAVTVDDGAVASLAWTTAVILPNGRELGAAAADWGYRCTTRSCMTEIADDDRAVKISTDEAFPFSFHTPPARDLDLDATAFTRIAGFFRAENPNAYGWQGQFPTFVLGSSGGGSLTYTPDANLLPTAGDEWIYVDLPLAGGEGWTRTGAGSLADVDYVEIHTDTWEYLIYSVWIDALTLY